jgi:hypothetical protein
MNRTIIVRLARRWRKMSDEVERAEQQGYQDARRAHEAGAAAAVRSVSVDAAVQPTAKAYGSGGAHQRSYQASAETLGILQELRIAFGLPTDSAVIRRALALARVIARVAQGANSILIRKNDGREQEIILRE